MNDMSDKIAREPFIILRRTSGTDEGQWGFDQLSLQRYVLLCCQEVEGGFKDKPGTLFPSLPIFNRPAADHIIIIIKGKQEIITIHVMRSAGYPSRSTTLPVRPYSDVRIICS